MRRVSPSMIAREELRLLAGGADRESNVVSALVEVVTRVVVEELFEAEQADYLGGRGRYCAEPSGRSVRGTATGRGRIRTAEGPIEVAVPQVRGTDTPFRSLLMSFLDRLVTEMYARGLSTWDVEDAFRDATGEVLISRSAVSEITGQLWVDYQVLITRDLAGIDVEYLFADAVFESLRRQGCEGGAAGGSPPTGVNTCCTRLWGTRSPRRVGPVSSATCSSVACGPRPTVTPDGAPGRLPRSMRR